MSLSPDELADVLRDILTAERLADILVSYAVDPDQIKAFATHLYNKSPSVANAVMEYIHRLDEGIDDDIDNDADDDIPF